MRRVSVPFLVLVGLLFLAYYAGRRGVGAGLTAQVRAMKNGGKTGE